MLKRLVDGGTLQHYAGNTGVSLDGWQTASTVDLCGHPLVRCMCKTACATKQCVCASKQATSVVLTVIRAVQYARIGKYNCVQGHGFVINTYVMKQCCLFNNCINSQPCSMPSRYPLLKNADTQYFTTFGRHLRIFHHVDISTIIIVTSFVQIMFGYLWILYFT